MDFTNGGTMLGQLFIVTNSVPQLTLERTDSPTNTFMSFATTAGAIFAGHGAANTFAVKGDSDLATSPWFAVSAAGATFAPTVPVTAGQVTVTGSLSLPSGSEASLPARFAADTDTGFYRPAANTLAIVTGGTTAVTIDGSGNLTAAGFVNSMSDARIKTDISRITNPLHRLANISGYTYTRKTTGRREVGVIAQEVQRVLPEAVTTTSTGLLSVAYGNLAALLIESLKEQVKKRELLEQRLEAMERRLAS
jgi:hypothetical protein